jgi:PEP-CTERM motif
MHGIISTFSLGSRSASVLRSVAFACVGTLFLAAPAAAVVVGGTSSGVFVNPVPSGADVSGVGTSDIKFGTGGFGTPQNELIYTANNPFSGVTETAFRVGTLTYFNGTTAAGTGVDSIDLALTTTFTSPGGIGAVLSTFTLHVITTPNTGDLNGDADYVDLPSSFTPTVFTIGGTNYTVRLTGFQNVVGDGFLASSSTELHVREGLRATADLYAIVTTDITGGVPEPSTWAMMILGFAGVGFMTYRRRNQNGALAA